MTQLTKKILEEVSHLSPIDRAELLERIIESFDGEPDSEVKKAWSEEAERRLADYKGGRAELISEEDALYRVEKNGSR